MAGTTAKQKLASPKALAPSDSGTASASASNQQFSSSTAADKDELLHIYRQELDELKVTHAETLGALAKAERRLEELEVSNDAWREATEAANEMAHQELSAALTKAQARAEAQTKLLAEKAETSTRDVATLRAKQLLDEVHSTTLRRELAQLDGTVGFLVARLAACHTELDETLRAASAAKETAERSREKSSAAQLELQHLRHVAVAQRRTVEELRGHVAGAQAWAHDVEAQFHETLSQIRYAAAEELTVQGKRMRLWEVELKAMHEAHLKQMATGDGGGIGNGGGRDRHHNHRGGGGGGGVFMAGGAAAAAQTGKLLAMIEEERALIAEQARLFTNVSERAATQEAALLSKRLEEAEHEVDSGQHFERDFEGELKAVARADHDAKLTSVAEELEAARGRLREQEAVMARMEESMATSYAQQRAEFDSAIHGLLEKVSQMKSEEAVALSNAADGDVSIGLELQGAGDATTPRMQQRRKSISLARDMQLLAAISSPGNGAKQSATRKSGGSGVDGGSGGGGLDDASREELRVARTRLAELEEEMRSRLEEASAAATRSGDAYRRELAQAQRWSASLEASVEQAHAALEVQKEENLKLEGAVAELRAQLYDQETLPGGAVSAGKTRSANGLTLTGDDPSRYDRPVGSGASPTLPPSSSSILRARAVVGIPLGDFDVDTDEAGQAKQRSPSAQSPPGRSIEGGFRGGERGAAVGRAVVVSSQAPSEPLVVGSPSKPEDIALRPPRMWQKPTASRPATVALPSKHYSGTSSSKGRFI